MGLESLTERLSWPQPERIFAPSGAGPRVLVNLAKEKIERELARQIGQSGTVRVGLLTKSPDADITATPIAVVCEFVRPATPALLAKAHRLAWNFSRAPLLITVEPHLVRTWSCCEFPAETDAEVNDFHGEIADARFNVSAGVTASALAAHALNWVRLATGDFYRQFPDRFKRDGRADRALLEELTAVRKVLSQQGLPDDTIHDLLARVIFIQFLFDRKDSDGRAALNPALLSRLKDDAVLKQTHVTLETILADRDEAYRFFRWLNNKFNGDLFPGKGLDHAEQDAEWKAEYDVVEVRHLRTLSHFVSGTLRLGTRQRTLWRQYSFDVIPLEFISCIYEEFVTAKGAYYTPAFLVDFILDGVLPWDGTEWDFRVLDPSCGSGIFLVKAYQRLIQRWKNAFPDERPTTTLLKRLLERNLFGVDLDEHAVRVASFSLYLTMCDEIDPKSYLSSTKFPRLRGNTLVHADFFTQGLVGFDSEQDSATYDVVLGNAPWGKGTDSEAARNWAAKFDPPWEIPSKQIGTLFLIKAASLCKETGRVSMIQPASALLFNRSGPAQRFRQRFFASLNVEEIVNLSPLRFDLFENAVSPPCIVTLVPVPPTDTPITFIAPKQVSSHEAEVGESSYTVIVEPSDISYVHRDEASDDEHVWTALSWGGRRDFALVKRLRREKSLQSEMVAKRLLSVEGVIRGNGENTDHSLVGRRILEEDELPDDVFLTLDPTSLPENTNPHFERPRTKNALCFACPQLLIKQGWTIESGRFRAVLVAGSAMRDGVICNQSFVTVHDVDGEGSSLNGLLLSYNSKLAVYWLLLTSGRLASYRPEPLVEEMRSVPFAVPDNLHIGDIESLDEVDEHVKTLMNLRDAEWALVDDLFNVTMADFKGDVTSLGRQPTSQCITRRCPLDAEPELAAYCEYFIRVLTSGMPQNGAMSATIFQDSSVARVPVRLVAFHFDSCRAERIVVEQIQSDELCKLLGILNSRYLESNGAERGGIFFQRVARVYHEGVVDGIPCASIYIIKPDRVRYWTKSAGLRDADEVAADLQSWQLTRASREQGRGATR